MIITTNQTAKSNSKFRSASVKKLLICLSVCFLLLCTKSSAQLTATDMVKAAKQRIENLTTEQAKNEIAGGNVVLIDIREAEELKQGKIAGAVHAPRGMLEFYADPTLPYYLPVLKKEARIILYCASSGRSALAVETLKAMGYKNITHINGGFKAWKEAGYPVAE